MRRADGRHGLGGRDARIERKEGGAHVHKILAVGRRRDANGRAPPRPWRRLRRERRRATHGGGASKKVDRSKGHRRSVRIMQRESTGRVAAFQASLHAVLIVAQSAEEANPEPIAIGGARQRRADLHV